MPSVEGRGGHGSQAFRNGWKLTDLFHTSVAVKASGQLAAAAEVQAGLFVLGHAEIRGVRISQRERGLARGGETPHAPRAR